MCHSQSMLLFHNVFVFVDKKYEVKYVIKIENNVEYDRSLRQFYSLRLPFLVHHSVHSSRTKLTVEPRKDSKPMRESINLVDSFIRIDVLSLFIRTTKFPMTNVNKKNGMHGHPAHSKQIHIDSIHSPHKTRKTILKENVVIDFNESIE